MTAPFQCNTTFNLCPPKEFYFGILTLAFELTLLSFSHHFKCFKESFCYKDPVVVWDSLVFVNEQPVYRMYSTLTRNILLPQVFQKNSLFYLKRDFSFSFYFSFFCPISLFNDGYNKHSIVVAMFCFKLNWGGCGGVRRLPLENPFSWRKVQTSSYRLFFPPSPLFKMTQML